MAHGSNLRLSYEVDVACRRGRSARSRPDPVFPAWPPRGRVRNCVGFPAFARGRVAAAGSNDPRGYRPMPAPSLRFAPIAALVLVAALLPGPARADAEAERVALFARGFKELQRRLLMEGAERGREDL